MKKSANPLLVRPKRSSFVFVCAKCVRRSDHGSSIRKALKAELNERATALGRRSDKVIGTKCMGLCPKQAVVVANGATLTGGGVLILKQVGDVPEAVTLLEGRAGMSAPSRSG